MFDKMGSGLKKALGALPDVDKLIEDFAKNNKKDAKDVTLQQALGAHRKAVERVSHHFKIGFSRFRDDESLAFAAKQAYAQFVFQCFDLLADRALCHAQLLRRLGEALLASAGLEGLECIEGRQAASHSVLQFIRKTRPYRRKDALRERSVCLDNLVNGGRFLMVGSSI